MKFFHFDQNNSGGSFSHVAIDGIGTNVFIEAKNAAHANDRAERIGLYFNGCDDGTDCSCCGDRWSPVSESDGRDVPMKYSTEWRAVVDDEAPTLDWGHPSYIHYIGGEFKKAVEIKP